MSRYAPQTPHLKPPHVKRRREGEERRRGQDKRGREGQCSVSAGVAAVINSLLNLSWSDLREREEMADKDCVVVVVAREDRWGRHNLGGVA